VLISSSFLSHAAWHTPRVGSHADIATQVLPDNKRHSELSNPHHSDRITPPQKTVQDPSQPSKASNPRQTSQGNDKNGNDKHANDRRAATHKGDASRTERNAETRRQARRARQKSTDEAQRTDNLAKDQEPATPANQETQPLQFLAILGDVLPQGATGASANASGMHAGPSGPTDQFSSLAQMTFSSGLAGGIAAGNLNVNESVTAAATQAVEAGNVSAAEKTSEAAMASAADGSGAHRQTGLNAEFDGAFAIKAQATTNGPGTVQAQKQSEVAFAARIAERTAAGAALGLNDAQATIAASRFDAASTGGQSGENRHGAANFGNPNQTVQSDASGEEAPDQTASMTDAVQADARPASGTQNGAVRSASSQPGTQPSAAATASVAHVSTASPVVTAGAPVTAAPSTAAPGAGNSSSAKAAADDRVPQFLEPQNEPSQRAGDSVRDISLKLTNKDQSSVQVRLSERAGELHVSVRTPDAGLTRGLREGLSDLVGRLEQSGYHAETWRPSDSASTAQDQGRENPSQQHSSQQQNAGGSGTDSRQQQNPRDQQQPGAQTPQWVSELESSLQRSNRSWQPSSAR